jgi:peroxiredoxin
VTPLRILRNVRTRTLALTLAISVALACGQRESEPAAAAPPPSSPGVAPTAAPQAEVALAAAKSDPPRPKRKERPLPAFSGWTLDGEALVISSFIGKRLLLYFFDPGYRSAPVVTEPVVNVAGLRGKHNFEIIGVATGARPRAVQEFVRAQGIEFPVVDDSRGAIARRLGLRAPLAMLGVDAEGYVIFGMVQFPADEDASRAIESQIREALRLPLLTAEADPVLGTRPSAPLFTAAVLDRQAPFELAAHRGTPVVLIFFLHTCPHCHRALRVLKRELEALPDDKRPLLVGIEISGRTAAVRAALRQQGLDFFPVVFDDDESIRTAYGNFAMVPEIFFIDTEGRIVERIRGWRDVQDPPLTRMRLAKLAGAPVPMLLRTNGYSGNEACGVCHTREHETWQFTRHATAFDSLVKHGQENDPECVSCHVVGYREPGGFVSPLETTELEQVGCETCHGRGGTHLSQGAAEGGVRYVSNQEARGFRNPEKVPNSQGAEGEQKPKVVDYSEACLACHDAKHSLGFEYASFLPRVSHAALAHITLLPLDQKQKLLAEMGAPRSDLLPSTAAHVGSDACKSCHEPEYATWAASTHAISVQSLAKEGKADQVECLTCHTTAFGREGGFPRDGSSAAHPDLARVGCESCHGPGGEHIVEGLPKFGNIVALGDKCDSCVILQICGSCHDEANDPGFEFAVLEKIEKQRHGTKEAGTGKPLDPATGKPLDPGIEAGGARDGAPSAKGSPGAAAAQLGEPS